MPSANVTQADPLLKRLYPNGVDFPVYQQSKFVAKMKRDTEFGGLGRQVNVTVGPTTGGSADFAEALANQGGTTEKNFFLVHRKEYQIGSIQNDLIMRAMGDKNAIVDIIKQQLDKARYAYARSLVGKAFGNGGGSKGKISSGSNVGTDTITLATPADITGFEPGMWLQLASDDGSAVSPAGVRDNGRKVQIKSVNRDAGTITIVTGFWNQIAGAIAGDFIFRSGDYAKAMSGVRGWNPITAPTTGDSFMSLDRFASGDVVRLSGVRVTSAGSKEDTIINAGAEASMNGFTIEEIWVSPRDMRDLLKEVGTKRMIDGETQVAGISFRGLELDTAGGTATVITEPDCPQGNFWAYRTAEQWTFRTAGDAPMFLNAMGTGPGKLLTAHDDDAHQFRLGGYGNFENASPGTSVIGTF